VVVLRVQLYQGAHVLPRL